MRLSSHCLSNDSRSHLKHLSIPTYVKDFVCDFLIKKNREPWFGNSVPNFWGDSQNTGNC